MAKKPKVGSGLKNNFSRYTCFRANEVDSPAVVRAGTP